MMIADLLFPSLEGYKSFNQVRVKSARVKNRRVCNMICHTESVLSYYYPIRMLCNMIIHTESVLF